MKLYPKIRPVGHRQVRNIFDGPVVVQEKIDGSNFAFGRTFEGDLFCLSRSRKLDLEGSGGQFGPAVEHVKSVQDKILPGELFRCEYLQKPKHNVLAYGRIPKGSLVLFDVELQNIGGGYSTLPCSQGVLEARAERLGIDVVPQIYAGDLRLETLNGWFSVWEKRPALLGGEFGIEGVVIKNYHKFDEEGNILIAKFVRKQFKESHDHKKTTEKTDPAHDIGASHGGPARWRKALQHLRDEGALKGEPEDIPHLMKRVQQDVEAECVEEIKAALWRHYRKNVLGAASRGLPEWYKEELTKADGVAELEPIEFR